MGVILPDKEIKKLIQDGAVYTEEGPEIDIDSQLGPSSLDLRLGSHFVVFQRPHASVIDTRDFDMDGIKKDIEVTRDEGITVHPGEFVLGSTLETVKLPRDLVARLEGRSSYGRLGIAVHSTAGYVDPGFEGQLTLEIQNLGTVPVRLYPGERICQIVFEKMIDEAEVPYYMKHDYKYMGQKQTTLSKLDEEKR